MASAEETLNKSGEETNHLADAIRIGHTPGLDASDSGGPGQITRNRRQNKLNLLKKFRDMKKNDKLQTPEWVYARLGRIDLDPCAGIDTSIGSVNWAIEREENGLERTWFGFVYCNPPFSQKEIWAEKMQEHGTGILILPERGNAPWFAPLVASAGHYWVMGKKINFVGGPSSNNLGSCLFPFGTEAVRRLTESGLLGHLVEIKAFRARSAT